MQKVLTTRGDCLDLHPLVGRTAGPLQPSAHRLPPFRPLLYTSTSPGPNNSAIVRELHKRLGNKVSIVVLDVAVNTKFGPLLPEVTYYSGDICAYSHIMAATAGCECVIHNAALVGTSTATEATVFRVNEQGTRNVVEACLERDVKTLVYTSSGAGHVACRGCCRGTRRCCRRRLAGPAPGKYMVHWQLSMGAIHRPLVRLLSRFGASYTPAPAHNR
jgi:hypothetical protein